MFKFFVSQGKTLRERNEKMAKRIVFRRELFLDKEAEIERERTNLMVVSSREMRLTQYKGNYHSHGL